MARKQVTALVLLSEDVLIFAVPNTHTALLAASTELHEEKTSHYSTTENDTSYGYNITTFILNIPKISLPIIFAINQPQILRSIPLLAVPQK